MILIDTINRMIAVLEMHHLGLLDIRTFQAKNIEFDGRILHELSLIHCLPVHEYKYSVNTIIHV